MPGRQLMHGDAISERDVTNRASLHAGDGERVRCAGCGYDSGALRGEPTLATTALE
jgi:hypothetical protein